MSIVEFLSQPLWQRLGLTLVHFLWQGLAVAVLAGAFVKVFRLKHGNARYGAYLLAFIAMIACPVVTFTVIDITISPDTELVTGAESAEVVETFSYAALPASDIVPEAETPRPAMPTVANSIPLSQRISDWLNVSMPWVLVIWMVGVIVLSVRLLMGFVGVYRWRHHLEPLPERLVQRIVSLSEGLGMRRFSRVFISPTVLQAMAVGYLRPMVLLPAAMVTQMQPEMLEAVIAHELAHIRRFDLWINLAQRVTETLLFYHPAVWWLSICLRSERELCCDELAVKATGRRLTYATTLESVGRAKVMAKQPVLAAGLGRDNKPTLGRVRHILGLKPTQRNCPFWLAGVITVLFLAALVIPTTLALTNRSDEKLNDFERVVVEGIRTNRDKFECGYLAWSSKQITTRFADSNRPAQELAGEYELWWDGNKKMATKYVRDMVYHDPEEGRYWVEKQQGGNSYDGGVLSWKPRFGAPENWLSVTRWRGEGSRDWMIRRESNMKNIRKDWSVIDANGAKLIRCMSKNMNETSQDHGAHSVSYYDPSKGYGLVNEESYNPNGGPRSKRTFKMLEVIPGGWFPVKVDSRSFAITDGKVYFHNHFAMDIERCSFNDKSALPKGIFKLGIEKQLKYQEKVQKYLAMELRGISDVKEAAKADKVKRGAREAIEKFVAAAMAGDFETGRQFADPDKAPYDQIEELPEVLKGQNMWIMAVVADDFDAIGVSSVIDDHERTMGPLVFFLDRKPQDGRDNWWLHDIDMETPDSAEGELKQFLEKHPKAQKVPYEKKAAGAEVSNDFKAMGDDQGDIRVITDEPTGVQRTKAQLIKPEIIKTSDGRAKLSYSGRYVISRDLAKLVIEKIDFITDKNITRNDGKNQLSIVCPTTEDAETVVKFLQEVDVEPLQVRIDLRVVETYPDVELDWETRVEVTNITRTMTTSNAKPGKSLSAADILRETVKTEPQPENSIEKLIDLLTSKGYLKILMNPTIEVINGKTAKIESSSHLSTGKEIIDLFEVTPRILDDGNIDVATKMVFQNKQMSDPRTHINIKDSGSLVIGSVTKTEKRDIVRDGVKGSEERTTEVLVILTPTIITPEMNLSKKSDVQVEIQEKRNQKELSKFKKTLAIGVPVEGVTVELMGVCDHPSEGKQWWRPDGSLLKNSPYDDDFGRAFPKDGEKGYKFAVKYSGMAGRDIDAMVIPLNAKTTNGGASFMTSKKNGRENMKYLDGSLDEKIVWLGAAFDEELGNCDIRIGVCFGDWKRNYRYETDQSNDAVEWVTFKNVSLKPNFTTLANGVTVEQPATIRVPEDYPTAYAAVNAAKAGDTIVISADRLRGEDILIEPKLEIEVEKTISPKLVMLLGAINSCAAETELNIESISIKARDININGDTAGRTNTQKFLDAVKKNGLEILRLSLGTRGNRDRFSIDVEPKKNSQQLPQHKTGVQLGFEKIISPKLAMLLGAINSCAAETELNIESILIKARNININGDTSSRANTRKFFDAIKKNGLVIVQLRHDTKDNRDKFSIIVETKKDWQQHKTDVPVGGDEIEKKEGFVWGKQVNGLRAAVVFVPEKESYSLGERVEVRFHIQNVSDHDIQIASTSWRQENRIFVQDEQGKEISVSSGWFSGLAHIVRYILKPRETVVLESSGLGFGDAAKEQDVNTKPLTSNFIRCGPGRYFVYYKLKLPDIISKDGDGKVTVPQPDDWQGTLETGKRKLVLTSTAESDQKSTVEVEAQGGWGEAVEGVQVRLRPVKDTWEAGEKPIFKADIRNRGGLELTVSTADEFCQLEIDRLWYGWSGPFGLLKAERLLLGPGSQINDISISLAKKWVGPRKALTLTAGMHTVRVAFILQRPERKYQDIVRAISNPIEIKILPTEKKTDVPVEAGKEALTAEKLVLKLVDNSGRPVAGAKVGTSVRTRDKQVLNSKLSWSLSGKEKDVSDKDGKIVLTQDKLFPQSWNPDRKRTLYILNEERQIGAFCEISKDNERNQIELTLEPVCHVHGKLSSKDLEEIGRPLTWSNVYLGFNKDSQSVLSCMSEKQQFDFWVPPGEYKLRAYGSGDGARTKAVRPIIEVKTGQSELDLGVVDLPATTLSKLIGKSAPEIGPIKAWKNGSPITLAELRGKAVIIYFDGTSPNTSRDLPRLVDLHNQFEANGLVIVALYNCPSMEALETKWVEVYKKYGGVQNVPFRVAVDGGKSTFYEGSGKERPGATYAIYDITADPTTILIDPDGKIVEKLGLYGAKEKLEKMLGVEVKTTVSAWRQRFEEVYRLEDNRILKRIAPPFIPERRDYYVNEHSNQASIISTSPDRFIFHWNGKLKNWGLGFTNKLGLGSTLGHVLRLKSFEYDGPQELLSIELPGDWIIRDEVTQKVKLKALEQLIAEELSRTIQFEKRTVERRVIVATGSFKFHPLPAADNSNRVYMFSDKFEPNAGGGGGTADSVAEFLGTLGNRVGVPVIDETEAPREMNIVYNHHRSAYLSKLTNIEEKAKKLQMLFANLTKQTELQFRIEKRPVEVWFIAEKKKDK